MAGPLPLRPEFDADMLRREAGRSRDGAQARRLLALTSIYDVASRSKAAKIGGVTLQIVRDRVVRFNAEGPAGLIDRKPPGSAPKLGASERQALAQMVERGPIPAVHGVVRWRLIDLHSGCGRNSAFRSAPRRSAASCGRSAIRQLSGEGLDQREIAGQTPRVGGGLVKFRDAEPP